MRIDNHCDHSLRVRWFLTATIAAILPLAGCGLNAKTGDADCGRNGTAYVRTTLYFGLSHSGGTISQTEWDAFLHDQVTPRFPQGLTVWEADGQWRRPDATVGRERAKVLLLVHDGKAKAQAALNEVVSKYKESFHQESVLWESAKVCAAF